MTDETEKVGDVYQLPAQAALAWGEQILPDREQSLTANLGTHCFELI